MVDDFETTVTAWPVSRSRDLLLTGQALIVVSNLLIHLKHCALGIV